MEHIHNCNEISHERCSDNVRIVVGHSHQFCKSFVSFHLWEKFTFYFMRFVSLGGSLDNRFVNICPKFWLKIVLVRQTIIFKHGSKMFGYENTFKFPQVKWHPFPKRSKPAIVDARGLTLPLPCTRIARYIRLSCMLTTPTYWLLVLTKAKAPSPIFDGPYVVELKMFVVIAVVNEDV